MYAYETLNIKERVELAKKIPTKFIYVEDLKLELDENDKGQIKET